MIVDLSADDVKRIYEALAMRERDVYGALLRLRAKTYSENGEYTKHNLDCISHAENTLFTLQSLSEKFKRLQNCN